MLRDEIDIILHPCNHSPRDLLTLFLVLLADTVFRSDSLQKALVTYFDRYGTSNDRMLVHYLLGRPSPIGGGDNSDIPVIHMMNSNNIK